MTGPERSSGLEGGEGGPRVPEGDTAGGSAGQGALTRSILAEIRAQGPMPFVRFMELALYHPRLGYYCRRREEGNGSPVGWRGDFFTSPSLGPLFGTTLARFFCQLWREWRKPRPFWLIEAGPGPGWLACDVLRGMADCEKAAVRATRLGLVEAGPQPQAQARVAEAARQVGLGQEPVWARSLGRLAKAWGWDSGGPAPTAVLYANELLDAFPVHRVRRGRRGLEEAYVDAVPLGRAGRRTDGHPHPFRWRWGPPSTPALEAYLAWQGIRLRLWQEAEINLAALAWLQELDQVLGQGKACALLIDYGYLARDLVDPTRRRGTLLAYYRHQASEDVLADPGGRDLTAHVDFSALMRKARDLGWQVREFTSQGRFLVQQGIVEEAQRMAAGAGQSEEERRATAQALRQLVEPAGLGQTFRVLALQKG